MHCLLRHSSSPTETCCRARSREQHRLHQRQNNSLTGLQCFQSLLEFVLTLRCREDHVIKQRCLCSRQMSERRRLRPEWQHAVEYPSSAHRLYFWSSVTWLLALVNEPTMKTDHTIPCSFSALDNSSTNFRALIPPGPRRAHAAVFFGRDIAKMLYSIHNVAK